MLFLALVVFANNYVGPPVVAEEEETTAVAAWAPGGMEERRPGDGDEFASDTQVETAAITESPAITYELTEAERNLVESVVMGEAGGECFKGQMAVAKCILNACIITGERPDHVIEAFQYTTNRPAPSEDVIAAVSAVFDYGESVIGDDVLFFYNPDYEASPWHEAQEYVCTIGNHRFFRRTSYEDT